MIIDTHVHYNLEPLFSNEVWLKVPEEDVKSSDSEVVHKYGVLKTKDDGWYYPKQTWKEHWEKAKAEGITKSIVVGTDFHSNHVSSIIAENEPNLFCAAGEHPTNVTESSVEWLKDQPLGIVEDWVTDLEEFELVLSTSKLVAIGEVGLDYFHMPEDKTIHENIKMLQQKAFIAYIKFAQEKKLPLIIHVRDKETPEEPKEGNAYWDALAILQKHDVKNFTLHCVSGPLSYVKAAIEMGGYMGFDGNITYPNAQHIRDIFKLVPEDKRLVETDAPFLPPQGFRGKICEPWMLAKTVEYIGQELKVDKESFAKNAERLFKLV